MACDCPIASGYNTLAAGHAPPHELKRLNLFKQNARFRDHDFLLSFIVSSSRRGIQALGMQTIQAKDHFEHLWRDLVAPEAAE